jgi:MFS family permease
MTATQEVGGAASYRGLVAQPVLRRLAVADVCARLPQGMVSLTLLLVAAQHASMTVAGLVVAGYTLGQAVTGPVRGRLADRRGLVPVASVCAAGYALALLALLATSLARAPAGLLIGVATVAGLVNPPLSPGMRSLWSTYAGAGLTQTARCLPWPRRWRDCASAPPWPRCSARRLPRPRRIAAPRPRPGSTRS